MNVSSFDPKEKRKVFGVCWSWIVVTSETYNSFVFKHALNKAVPRFYSHPSKHIETQNLPKIKQQKQKPGLVIDD